jgi:hypothetical protein
MTTGADQGNRMESAEMSLVVQARIVERLAARRPTDPHFSAIDHENGEAIGSMPQGYPRGSDNRPGLQPRAILGAEQP